MNQDPEIPSGEPQIASGEHGEESDSQSKGSAKDQVSYDTYKRTISQVKSLQNKLKELTEKAQLLEDEKLKAEGKKEELVESYKKKYEEEKSKRSTQLRAFADEILFRQFESEAAKLGCIKPDDLFVLYKGKLQDLDVSDDLKVSAGEVKEIIESAKLERPFYFKKDSPKIATDIPGETPKPKQKQLSEMTIEELKSMYRKLSQ